LKRRGEKKDHSGLGTRSVWAGEKGKRWEGATQIPVALSVAFGYDDVNQWLDVAQGKTPGHIYSRNTNPTVGAFEEKIRNLEMAEAATSFSSGMAAISNTLFALLSPGDRVVSVKDTYGGTNKLLSKFSLDSGLKRRSAIRPATKQSKRQSDRGARLSIWKALRIQPLKLSISPDWLLQPIVMVQ